MKFQRTSLILVFAALALGGYVYYNESKKPPQVDEAKSDEKPLFNFKEQDVQALTVQTPKLTVSFEPFTPTIPPNQKGKPQIDRASSWLMRKPEVAPADEGAIAFLLNLLATGKSDRSFSVPAARKSEFGLNQPSATVDVKLNNQQTHRLVIGKPNFNRNFLYALVDPPMNQDLSVLLIPINFQNAVDRPLSEWKRDKPKPSPSVSSPASPQ
ncbi:MAG: DUF4340 domain-containing protein [Plectolyngbya sp. WJT66-NPBG17]|jgi:hypothetical protein|nr:DUF4340 domain-containing protein [Plectolyngbya sp. WJT66-NPBG17]MBW4524475.1 DUF4340 domain-containing protein [Phormidium tanganyikae FI6-MK23]